MRCRGFVTAGSSKKRFVPKNGEVIEEHNVIWKPTWEPVTVIEADVGSLEYKRLTDRILILGPVLNGNIENVLEREWMISRTDANDRSKVQYERLPYKQIVEKYHKELIYFYEKIIVIEKNDPLSIMKVPREMSEPTTRSVVLKGIVSGFAYFMRNEDEDMVAFRSATIRTRDEPTYIKTDKADDRKHPFMEFNRKLFERISLWAILPPEIDRILWISLISVRLDYTRTGLAKKLLTFDGDDWKTQNIQVICAFAAALKSQILFGGLGFKVEAEVLHSEIVSDLNGEQIVRCIDGTDRHQLVRLNIL